MVRTEHETVENVRFWKRQVEGWLDANVHGKAVDDVVGIAGDVVVELGDEWGEDDVESLYAGLYDADIPVCATRGTRQVRVDATDDRLPVPYLGAK